MTLIMYCDLCGSQIQDKGNCFKVTVSAEEVFLLPQINTSRPVQGTWHYDSSMGTWSYDMKVSFSYTSSNQTWMIPRGNASTTLVLHVCKDCHEKLKPFLTGLKEAMEKIVRE